MTGGLPAAFFVLEGQVSDDRVEALLAAYGKLRERLEKGVDGLLWHQLCQATDEPERWVVASGWESAEASSAWLRSEEHRELTSPMRECFGNGSSSSYVVRDGLAV